MAMVSHESVELVADAYAAFARGDNETALSYYDREVEFSQPDDEPGGGTYHGVDGVVEAFRKWLAPWDEYRVDLEEITDHGQHVLARTRHHMRGKASGIDVEKIIFQLWTLRDGRIVRVRMYYDEAEALAAISAA
jgi:ketosteroid isomerase-like protein